MCSQSQLLVSECQIGQHSSLAPARPGCGYKSQVIFCRAGTQPAGPGHCVYRAAMLYLSLSNTADYQPSPRRAALLPAQLQLPAAGLLSPPRPELPRAQQLRAGPQLRSSGASRNVGAASAGRCRPRLGSGSRLPASRSPDTLHPPGAGR